MKNYKPASVCMCLLWLTTVVGCVEESVTPHDTCGAKQTTANARESLPELDVIEHPNANTLTFVVPPPNGEHARKAIYIVANIVDDSVHIYTRYDYRGDRYSDRIPVETYALLTGRMPLPPPQCGQKTNMPCPDSNRITVEWMGEDNYKMYYQKGYYEEKLEATFSSPAFQMMMEGQPDRRLVAQKQR